MSQSLERLAVYPVHASERPAPPAKEAGEVVLRAARGVKLVNVGELWACRELIGFLMWRDVKVRYKQTVLGAAWAVLQPAMMMVVFTVFFRGLAGVPSGDVPYPLFAYAGLLPWTFFASAVTNAGNSVVGSERLITKIYFPRLAIPFAAVGAAAVDFGVAFGLLLLLMAYYGVAPGATFFLLPAVFVVLLLAALGVGTLLAALNVAYRDFRFVIPFLTQLWMFATPTVYLQPTEPAPAAVRASEPAGARGSGPGPAAGREGARTSAPAGAAGVIPFGRTTRVLLLLNPMTPVIHTFRVSVLGGPFPWQEFARSSGAVAAVFALGCLYFRKVEDDFADII
jgi:lipopolysaccharide transport system permease protein